MKIYEEGIDHVAKTENFVWEITGWWWKIHKVNAVVDQLKPNDKAEVDKISDIVNKYDKKSFSERQDFYENICKYIK